jgi:long-chain-fatty-acid---luciferin-component ligase
VSPEVLRADAVETLGLRDDGQVRDVFNQVELNTAFVECAQHQLHVPPWVEVIVRDPYDLSPVPPGETGLLSYLDPSATSYPCFLISEDIGMASTDGCACGRHGQTVEIRRRLLTSDHQGCALRLADTTHITAR